MLALIKKDLFSVRSYFFKQYAIMLVLFTSLSIYMKSSAYFSGVLMMVSYVMISSGTSFDEASGLNRFARTMPLTVHDIVGAKYVLAICGLGVGALCCLLVGGVVVMLVSGSYLEHLITTAVCALLFLFAASVNTPILLRYGAEKSRLIITIGYMLPFLIGMFGIGILKELQIPMPSEATLGVIGWILAALVLAVFVASYFISVAIVKKKEY